MGKIIEYNVTLYPAKCERGYVVTSFEIGSDVEYPGLRFEADSVKAMLARVTAFATTHGKSCNASVRCIASRKPAGFDKATKGLYFNLVETEAA